ncbi:hypothetical protein O0L34_g12588 [Tuta absoluta]|nr:hypothetical protein O0L34_g12588 [Tuta absoluta]
MEQIIVTEQGRFQTRTYVLLALNIIGVLSCVVITILILLWAHNIIWMEKDLTPILRAYLENATYHHNKDDYRRDLYLKAQVPEFSTLQPSVETEEEKDIAWDNAFEEFF